MFKHDEMSDPRSCWNKAGNGEFVFVLLERDDATPDTIRYWASKRIELGKNKPDDPQIVRALEEADIVERLLKKRAAT